MPHQRAAEQKIEAMGFGAEDEQRIAAQARQVGDGRALPGGLVEESPVGSEGKDAVALGVAGKPPPPFFFPPPNGLWEILQMPLSLYPPLICSPFVKTPLSCPSGTPELPFPSI